MIFISQPSAAATDACISSGWPFIVSESRPTYFHHEHADREPQKLHAESAEWSNAKLGRATKCLSHLTPFISISLSHITTSSSQAPRDGNLPNISHVDKQHSESSRLQINTRVRQCRGRHCRSHTSFARNGFGEACLTPRGIQSGR
jgi:hypothetical protein